MMEGKANVQWLGVMSYTDCTDVFYRQAFLAYLSRDPPNKAEGDL